MSVAQDEHNRAGFLTFLGSMIFTFLFFGYLVFVHPGVKLENVKGKTPETTMADTGAAAGAAVDVSGNKTPWVSSPEMVAHGKTAYQNNCAFCHGNTGVGDGPAGATLVPKPRNLVEGKWTADGSTIGLFKTIAGGLPGTAMAAFGHLPLNDRWAMVHYIQSITKNKIVSPAQELEQFAQGAK